MHEGKDLIHFFKIMARLKRIPRSGWLMKVGVKDPESVAEHTFMTSIFCMIIGDMRNLDTLKMLKMALLHDACEAIIGDSMPYEIKKKGLEKRKLEDDAMIQILSKLPDDIKRIYSELWKEFQDGFSSEAKLVREMDKLEMALQALEYEEEGYDRERLSEFWETARQAIKDPEAKVIFKVIKDMRKFNLL
ncbi:MAG: HD domain-containing protein [Candidatus Methylarchaceae archaeon HK01M]|nr:HD domain-containing protein [Candidatus Methylarchaceae archaeon HK01M]